MANALEIAFGWTPKEVPHPIVQVKYNRAQRPKSRSQAAVEWMRQTGSTQRQAARQFSLSQASISLQLKYNREACYCPSCKRKMPVSRHSLKQSGEKA